MNINLPLNQRRKMALYLLASVICALSSLTLLAQDTPNDQRQLILGQRIERRVVRQELHIYSFEMKAGQVLRVEFVEKGADITAVVTRQIGQEMVSLPARSGRGFMKESLIFRADRDGIYDLNIKGEQVTAPTVEAKYEFTAVKSDVPSPRDLKLLDAEMATGIASVLYISMDKEKYPFAISKLEASNVIWRELGDRYREGMSQMYIGELYFRLGDLAKAEAAFKAAFLFFDQSAHRSEIAHTLANLGGVYVMQKDEKKARTAVDGAIEIFRSFGDLRGEEAARMLVSGTIEELESLETGRRPDFEAELQAARSKKDRALEALVWARMTFRYAVDADGESSRSVFQRAEAEGLPLARALKDRDSELKILIGLGFGFSDLGGPNTDEATTMSDARKAKSYLIQSLILARTLNNKLFECVIFVGLTDLYSDDVNNLSIYFGKKSINTAQSVRETFKSGSDKETAQLISRSFAAFYEIFSSVLTDEDRLQEAVQVANMARDQEFFDLKLIETEPPPRLIFTSREGANDPIFENQTRRIIEGYSSRPGADLQLAANELRMVFETLEKNFEDKNDDEISEDDIVRNVPDVTEMQSALKDLSAKTGKKHVALYYFANDGTEILLITPESIKLFSGEQCDPKVFLAFLEVLRDARFDPRPLGWEIYKKLFKAQESTGTGTGNTLETELVNYGADALHWSLTGKIRYIPLAALYDADNSQYLVEKFENVIFTRAAKKRFLAEPKAWTSGLGFGTSVSYPPFDPLPGVETELQSIFGNEKTMQKGSYSGRVFMNKEFKRESLLTIPQTKPAFVHIASHFHFQPGDAKNSYLLLGDGGRLSLLDLQLSAGLFGGVDLLTLSACETAGQQSDEATGKEVDGFAELAQRLGASAVMATLWKISDRGTSELMSRFYKLRQENPSASKSEILRLAQLNLLNGSSSWEEGRKRRSSRGGGNKSPSSDASAYTPRFTPATGAEMEHPHYWAPFVLYGSANGAKTNLIPKPAANTFFPVSNGNNRTSELIGRWEGLFDQAQYYAALEIDKVDGNTFTGILRPYGGEVAVSGFIDPATRQISFIETRLISLGSNLTSWTLGSNRGTLSPDGKSMLGTGFGGTTTYNWSFTKSGALGEAIQPPRNPVTLKELQMSFEAKLFDETIRKGRTFVSFEPNNVEARLYLGYALLLRNYADESVVHLLRAVNLGAEVPFFLKRGRPNPLGLGDMLTEGKITVSGKGVVIVDGGKNFSADYSSLTAARLENLYGTCPVAYFQGNFVETRTNSEKVKAERKDFVLLPPTAGLVPVKQGSIISQITCSDQGVMPAVLIRLITEVRSRTP